MDDLRENADGDQYLNLGAAYSESFFALKFGAPKEVLALLLSEVQYLSSCLKSLLKFIDNF